jgi:hypothetical protein
MVHIPGGGLGAIVTFRYLSPTATDKQPQVMVLTEHGVDGNLHGLNLRYLTPIQQQQLQHYWYPPGPDQSDHINPFQQEQIKKYEQQQEVERRRQELEAHGAQGVIMNPDKDATWGGIPTWVKSPVQVVQGATRSVLGKLRQYVPWGGQQKPPPPPEQSSPFANINQETAPQINDPVLFYYKFVKPVLGMDTKKAYRKYKLEYIKNFHIDYMPQRQYQRLQPAQRRWFPRLFGRKREEEE